MWSPRIEPSKPTYMAIALALRDDLIEGRLSAGQRLPTHRELSRRLGIAIGTVTRGYAQAEAWGVIHGRVGRGTFAGPMHHAPRHPAAEESATMLDLGVTWPIHEADPDLQNVLRILAARPDLQEMLRYTPHAGALHHRAAGAQWASRWGIRTTADRVVVCAGVQHALIVALATVAKPGDVLLTEALTYPGIKAAARLLRLRVRGVEIDQYGVRPDALRDAIRLTGGRILYTIPTIHNPTTATQPEQRRREIAQVAEEFGTSIIEDDVLRLIAGDSTSCYGRLAPALTYSVVSLSKCVAGGLRIAYLVVPDEAREAAMRNTWASIWNASPLSAEIARMWIEDGTAEATVQRKRLEAARRSALAAEIFEGERFRCPPRAYHMWLELPATMNTADFCDRLRKDGILVTPGEAFAVARGERPHAVRIGLSGAPDIDVLQSGLEKVAAALR